MGCGASVQKYDAAESKAPVEGQPEAKPAAAPDAPKVASEPAAAAKGHTVSVGYRSADGSELVPVKVCLRSGRDLPAPMTLAANGFQLVKFDPGFSNLPAADPEEQEKQIKERLYPAFEQLLLKECAGAKKVHLINHGLRASDAGPPISPPASPKGAAEGAPPKPVQAPVKEAHSDFSESISPLVARKLGLEEEIGGGRFLLINLWMSVDPENPVLQWPLAFCDAQSVPADDLLDNFLKKKGEDENEWSGEMAPKYRTLLKHSGSGDQNDQHGWYYFPQLAPDEAIIFKQFDTTTSESKACIHTACDIEEDGFPRPFPARKSVEVRALVIFEEEKNNALTGLMNAAMEFIQEDVLPSLTECAE